MPIQLTIQNMFQLTSLISPIIIVSFLVLISILNQNLKGLIYLAGVLISTVLNIFLMNFIKSPINPKAVFTCNLIELPFMNKYNSPASSSVLLAFTAFYLLQPLFMNHGILYNIPLTILLFSIIGLDVATKVYNKCTTISGAFIGCLFGMFCSIIWYNLFKMSGYESLLYFDELDSNNVQCTRPSKQTFKCSVYKNGQLISNNIV
tara:strand:- start:5732 stop:6346 length:615 start_codon:yes stop_codon:yes gene_type:complete